jgi:hypothetical protein
MANGDNNTDGDRGRIISKEADEALGVLLLIAAVAFLLTGSRSFFAEQFCVNIQQPRSVVQEVDVGSSTPAGSCVRTISSISIHETAAGAVRGQQPSDARGRLLEGIETVGSTVWRNVDFRTGGDGWVRQSALSSDPLVSAPTRFINIFTIISTIISLAFVAVIVYATVRISQIRNEEREELNRLVRRALRAKESTSNRRWDHVIEHIESPNEGDWRTAILEADVMLNEMMEAMGYAGDSLGDKLKQVDKSDFNTIEKAWKAHKKRNKIAHKGREYSLTQREAQQIIGLYEDVFEEFEYI